MEDKQIIELYWNRSENAIKETEEKYGKLCSYIAFHILENEEDTELCVKESYEKLWDSMPPRRPQNLKGYLCKITRAHALNMRYPEINGQEADFFTAELIMQDFLNGLESEMRKLFIAHYWYFSSVSEIALQYKMSENEVDATLRTLRQKLDAEMEQKNIHLQTEAELLYAMTEGEDGYLEEAEPEMPVSQKTTSPKVMYEKKIIPVIACAFCLVLLVFLWPKNPAENNTTESEMSGAIVESEEPNSEDMQTGINPDDYITILGEGKFLKDDIELMKKEPFWTGNWEIEALPIYKNLSNEDSVGVDVYMDEDTISSILTEIAEKLNMEFIDYYPIISVEEATTLLQEGNYRCEIFDSTQDDFVYKEEDVLGVDLMYKLDAWGRYYQPYYCFYIYVEQENAYARFYVPAVKGANVNDKEPIESEVQILHWEGYERIDGMYYYKDGKYYTIKNGAIVEAKDYDTSEDPYFEYGEVIGEDTEHGTEWILYYRGEEILNLSELNIPLDETKANSLEAKYIDGKVVVFAIEYLHSDYAKGVATVYLYSKEEQLLTPIMFSVPIYSGTQLYGLDIKQGRYPTMGNEAGEVLIVDLLTGESVNTGIRYDEIDSILSASDKYYAFVYKTGEISLIDKASGKIFKKAKYPLSFTPDSITYQDNMLYIQFDYGSVVFVIKEFE